jgi:hypothetical protein
VDVFKLWPYRCVRRGPAWFGRGSGCAIVLATAAGWEILPRRCRPPTWSHKSPHKRDGRAMDVHRVSRYASGVVAGGSVRLRLRCRLRSPGPRVSPGCRPSTGGSWPPLCPSHATAVVVFSEPGHGGSPPSPLLDTHGTLVLVPSYPFAPVSGCPVSTACAPSTDTGRQVRQKSTPNGVRWTWRRRNDPRLASSIAASTSGCAWSTW